MFSVLCWISTFYFAFAWGPGEDGFKWLPENSIILRSLGWNQPRFFEFHEPYKDDQIEFDDFFSNETYFKFLDDLTWFDDDIWTFDDHVGLESFDLIGGDIIPCRNGNKKQSYTENLAKVLNFWAELPYPLTMYIYDDRCSSVIGMIGGAQNVTLGPVCYSLGVIMHELLHALGFNHEQSRSDRDKYINILWDNIQKGHEKNFEKEKPEEELLLTPYDYDSIMQYGEYSFSKNKTIGLKTTTAKKKDVVLKNPSQKVLSKSDIKRIYMLYNC